MTQADSRVADANFISTRVTNGLNFTSLLISKNFTFSCDQSIFQLEKLVKDQNHFGDITTRFHQIRPFKAMTLTNDARRILETPNAGGNSIESEVLSFEIFKK